MKKYRLNRSRSTECTMCQCRALSSETAAALSPFTPDLSKITDGATVFSKKPNLLIGMMVMAYLNGVGTRENVS